jgi:hypothetical protein
MHVNYRFEQGLYSRMILGSRQQRGESADDTLIEGVQRRYWHPERKEYQKVDSERG